MKKSLLLVFVLALIGILFSTCKKDDEITCNLSTGKDAPSDMVIIFKAEQTGDGKITELTYKTSEEQQTLSNPSLPWVRSVDAKGGTALSITAKGTVKNGSLQISYVGVTATDSIAGSDFCSQHTD